MEGQAGPARLPGDGLARREGGPPISSRSRATAVADFRSVAAWDQLVSDPGRISRPIAAWPLSGPALDESLDVGRPETREAEARLTCPIFAIGLELIHCQVPAIVVPQLRHTELGIDAGSGSASSM